METRESSFYTVEDVVKILAVSKSTAYKLMAAWNKDLRTKGFYTFAGRIPKSYLHEKIYSA